MVDPIYKNGSVILDRILDETVLPVIQWESYQIEHKANEIYVLLKLVRS